MISLDVLFWIFVALFVFIGAMRGWAKEVLVTFAGILAVFIITVLVPLIDNDLEVIQLFWVRFAIIVALIFFGYQTPNFRRIAESGRLARSQARDVILGALFGGLNGYIIFSTIWSYMASAGYPFSQITAPDTASEAGQAAIRILNAAIPNLLVAPRIYFAIAIALGFVLVVLI